MESSLAIQNVTVVTMDEQRSILRDAVVVVEKNQIAEVSDQPGYKPRVDRIIDGGGKVLLPGLINCHAHTRPARALGDGMSMEDWHRLYAENITRYMTVEDSRAGSMIGFGEAIKTGTTSIMDMTYKPLGAGEAAKEIGIRATIVPLASDHPDMMDCCDSFEDNVALMENHADICPGRVRFWVGCDSIIETSPAMLEAMAVAAREYGVGIHTHMSEAQFDTEYIPAHYDGKRAAEFLKDSGVLGNRTVLAHCNWLTDNEIDLLHATDTKVAHCPTSNMRFGTGRCRVPDLLEAGVTVGLATDGLLSNFKMDMFEVMRGALMLQRINNLDPNALGTTSALEMATIGGARAFGLEDEIGSVEPGKKADLILLDFTDIKFSPWVHGEHDNLMALLVWTASGDDVETVIIDGEVVLENRRLTKVAEAEIVRNGTKSAERILSKIPLDAG